MVRYSSSQRFHEDPVNGDSVQSDPSDYELKSKVLSSNEGGDYFVIVEYRLLRRPRDKPRFHWTASERQKACFRWDSDRARFNFDRDKSQMTFSKDDPVLGYLARHGYLTRVRHAKGGQMIHSAGGTLIRKRQEITSRF